MRQKVLAVKDHKVGIFLRPVFEAHIGNAVRSFEDACKTADSMFGRHPNDYSLFEIGEYDSNNGQFINLDFPKELITARAIVDQKSPQMELMKGTE